jgi:hypothetical protein
MAKFKKFMKNKEVAVLTGGTTEVEINEELWEELNTFCNEVADMAIVKFDITDQESALVYRNVKSALTYLLDI